MKSFIYSLFTLITSNYFIMEPLPTLNLNVSSLPSEYRMPSSLCVKSSVNFNMLARDVSLVSS